MSFLRPAELAYQGVNRFRRALYRKGVLRPRRLPRPVISIGNLAVGGSGKTPTVVAVASELQKRGKKVTVLTRGYRRRQGPAVLVVNGPDPVLFGDEPVLLSRRLPGIDVVVTADRYRGAMAYLQERDCDLFILDDGFQHLQLHRDVDIVLLTSRSQWYREGRSALADADLVLVRTEGEVPPPPGTFRATLTLTHLVYRGKELPLGELRAQNVVAFSGLADNDQFFEMVRPLVGALVATRGFPDHAVYSTEEISKLVRLAADYQAILVTTEKDAVKLNNPEIAWVRSEMKIEPAGEFHERLSKMLAKARQIRHPENL